MEHQPIACPHCGGTAVTLRKPKQGEAFGHYFTTDVYACVCGMAFTAGPWPRNVPTGDADSPGSGPQLVKPK